MREDAKVGIFVILGFLALALVVILLGDIRLQRMYKIRILFNDTSGLPEKAQVRRAGVVIGKVLDISLVDDKAQVTASIKKDVRIHADAEARIVAFGIVGTKYLEISSGSEEAPLLKDGDTIVGVDPVSVDKAVEEALDSVKELVRGLKQFGKGDKFGESLKAILENTENVTRKLDRALGDRGDAIRGTIENIDKMTRNLSQALEEEDVAGILEKIRLLLEEMEKIIERINRGEGVIGKLATDENMAEKIQEAINDFRQSSEKTKNFLERTSKLKIAWNYQLNYNVDRGELWSDFGLYLLPDRKKFYYFAVNNIGEQNSSSYSEGQMANTITVNAGRNWGLFSLYGGVIRSSGGFGGIFYPLRERMEMGLEVFRLSDEKPYLRMSTKLRLAEWCYFGVNGEDLLDGSSLNTSLNIILR